MTLRRPTHAAGYSWRKWEDPIVRYRRSRAWTALFYVACVEAGALAALWVVR